MDVHHSDVRRYCILYKIDVMHATKGLLTFSTHEMNYIGTSTSDPRQLMLQIVKRKQARTANVVT